MREAVFSRLDHYGVIEDTNVLDLFAGSGALAIEALSRGAVRATLVEAHGPAAQICRNNLKDLGITAAHVVTDRAQDFVARKPAQPWDVVFIDPPYNLTEEDLTLILARLEGAVHEQAVIVIERGSRSPSPTLPASWRLITSKKYGDTALFYAEPNSESDADAESNAGIGADSEAQ